MNQQPNEGNARRRTGTPGRTRGASAAAPGIAGGAARVLRGAAITFAALALLAIASPAEAQTGSVLARRKAEPVAPPPEDADPAEALQGLSWFTVPQPRPVVWRKHDHVQIIIRETSTARSQQRIDTSKEYEIKGEIKDFPQLTINDIIEGVLKASQNSQPAKLDLNLENEFKGDGKYTRSDDLSARVTAEVIEVWPNGHLVLEARTLIQTDEETSTILLSGVCNPRHVSPAGTIISNQLFDLRVIKLHEGQLRKTTKKGLIPRVLETIFSF